jgi:hypothetical protein
MRPGDVRYDVPLARVAHLYSDHVLTLAQHRHNLITLTPSEVAEHALTALAYGGALAERVESGRWSTAAHALIAGAGLERTAAAMGWDLRTMRIGLGQWVSEQHRLGLVDADRYAQVVHLIREEPT